MTATLPALLLGRGVEIEMVIRAMEAGTMRRLRPAGILSPRADDLGQSIRGVPVLGLLSEIEAVALEAAERGEPFRRIVATPSALLPEAEPDKWLARTRKLALPISRVDSLGEGARDTELAPLEIEDLLVRSTVTIDRDRLGAFLKGKRVIVTGGGGSIGSEICLRCAAFGAAELLIVESSEPALFQITEQLLAHEHGMRVSGALADVRDRARITPLFTAFAPDIVIHAAALKHVPYLEADWSEGIKTNIFGSVNVTDAAIAANAKIFVLISTDKAIEPVSMLGATKRFAEMYAQSRDAEFVAAAAGMRLVAVRFGNVLGSVGSVVPKFKAQIARGGPLTVTSPDMIRYFMTIREACDLVLTAASPCPLRRAGGRARRRLRAQDGPAGQDHGPGRADDPPCRLRAGRGYRDRRHGREGGRTPERDPLRPRRADGRDRARRRHGGKARLRQPRPHPGLARAAGSGGEGR